MSFKSWLFKYNCKKSDAKRDKGLATPSDVVRDDDILYGTDTKWHILDIYHPKNYNVKLPVIISVHGGGFVYGDKEVYQYYCMSLAKKGFVVINFNYRLAPKYKIPKCIEDTNMVFEWMLKNADKYGIDTQNIFAVGDSAGATILSVYAAILTNKEYAKKFSFSTPSNLKFNAIGLNCGLYNMRSKDKKSNLKDIFEHNGSDEELDLIAAPKYINEDYPPCFIMTAINDFLKENQKEIVNALEKNKIEYEYKCYGDEEHPLYHVFHCNIRTKDAKKANNDECEFFKNYFVG